MTDTPVTTRWAVDPVMAMLAAVLVVISIGALIAEMPLLAAITATNAILTAWRARYWGKKGYTTWR